jgi:GH15 family glucan-1,4-alpha-glucosidase
MRKTLTSNEDISGEQIRADQEQITSLCLPLHHYAKLDDFGAPSVAVSICTFGYLEALAVVGRNEVARTIFEVLLSHRNHVGLLSEENDPATGKLWGNFPQTYSMVDIIVAAMVR